MAVKTKRILIAPLNWGLGHATRCISLTEHLLRLNHQVFAVLTEQQQVLFEEHFGKRIGYIQLKEAPVHYKYSFAVAMVLQLPRFASQIKYEEKLIAQLIEKINPDLIISDNRFGFRSSMVRSIIMSHQLNIKAGIFSWLANKINHTLIHRFDAIWVPDSEASSGLSGELGHNSKLLKPIHFIGPLSRFNEKRVIQNPSSKPFKHQLVALLSGPEPMRTILENELVSIIDRENLNAVIVRGITNTQSTNTDSTNIEWHNHLPSEKIISLMEQSRNIVCRSGYSTLMDLAAIKRKAILIPTPGQKEQEYLARHFERSFGFTSLKQKDLKALPSLLNLHKEVEVFNFPSINNQEGIIKNALDK
jgi:uncharacterized protein (TIGR00661 family)